MAVRMSDVLMLNTMRNAKIVAGNEGLRKEVKRISFVDCPLSALTTVEGPIGEPGDLYISSLYLFCDDEKAIEQLFTIYIESNSAGSIIITEYVQELPASIYEFANQSSYPIIFVDSTIYYADIISEVSSLLFEDKTRVELSRKVERLLTPLVTQNDIDDLWNSISPAPLGEYLVISASIPEAPTMQISRLYNDFKPHITGAPYRDGGIFIVSGIFGTTIMEADKLISLIGEYGSDIFIGAGNPFTMRSSFLRQLRCSIDYMRVAEQLNIPVGRQSNLGIYALLCNCEDKERLREYCTSILGTLGENDKKSDLCLLDTVRSYIRWDGNYKEVAREMNQHENTIRYRISKARDILGFMGNNFDFLEALSVAIKAAELLKMY